jgi:hypothetical protein
MNNISTITNSQVTEIEQKLRLERDLKQEILNNASSNRNSNSPDAHPSKNRSGEK